LSYLICIVVFPTVMTAKGILVRANANSEEGNCTPH